MLELQKKVLIGVAFSQKLFKKELKKSVVWLSTAELGDLKKWLKVNYWQTHSNVIADVLYF
jgi:hypothetical protein